MPRASIFSVLSSLKGAGYISQSTKGDPYRITDAGRKALQREIEAGSPKQALPHPDAQVQQSNPSLEGVHETLSPVVQPVSHPLRGETGTRLETETDSQTTNGGSRNGKAEV